MKDSYGLSELTRKNGRESEAVNYYMEVIAREVQLLVETTTKLKEALS